MMDGFHNGYTCKNKTHPDLTPRLQDPTSIKYAFFNTLNMIQILTVSTNESKLPHLLTLMVMEIIVVSSSSVSIYSINPLATRSCQPPSSSGVFCEKKYTDEKLFNVIKLEFYLLQNLAYAFLQLLDVFFLN